MRLSARAEFSYGNTRLRARRGDLLRDGDYEHLIGRDVDELLGALASTGYAPDAEATRSQTGLWRVHETIRRHLSRSLEEMRSFYADRARELVDALLARFDIHNVIAVIRAHADTQRPTGAARGALIRIGWLVDPIAREALRQSELAGAIDLLARSTPDRAQARALRAAFGEYERTEDLAALERAIVRDHAARATAALAAAGPAARTLLEFERREIDERNLVTALRLRAAPSAGDDDRFLTGGSIPVASFGPVAHDPAPAAAVRALARPSRPAWHSPLQRWAASGDLVALERELERRRIGEAAALFVAGDPLSVDVPIAFTAAKRTEARNLRLLGESSVRGIHPDTVRRELLWPSGRA